MDIWTGRHSHLDFTDIDMYLCHALAKGTESISEMHNTKQDPWS